MQVRLLPGVPAERRTYQPIIVQEAKVMDGSTSAVGVADLLGDGCR